MTVAKSDILYMGIFMYKFLFEYTHQVTKWTVLFRIINFTILIFLTILSVINLFYADTKEFLKTMESVTSEFHMFGKYIIFICYKDEFARFVDDTSNFWTTSGFETAIKDEISSIYKYIIIFQRILVFSSFATVSTYYFKPFFSDDKLLLQGWIPEDNAYVTETSVLIVQCYFMAAGPCVIGFDCLFAGIIGHIVVQFRLLRYKFQSIHMDKDGSYLEDERARDGLKECVKHHQFLLNIFTRIRRIYSLIFLSQYVITLSSTLFELYVLTLSAKDLEWNESLRSLIYICVLLAQFALYCFPAEQVRLEALDIYNSIYKSKWYESKLRHQKDLIFIMGRAQKDIQFTAGGLIDVNVNLFLSVFRTAFSFFAIMREVLNV